MLSIRFISAIIISLTLIGGALWFRFVRVAPYTAELDSVLETEPRTNNDDLLVADFYNASTSEAIVATPALSSTDIVGRQLLTDYLKLKAQGQTDPENINTYATTLADSIKNIKISIPKVDATQVATVPESEANLVNYSSAITTLREEYKNLVAIQTDNNGGDFSDINNSSFLLFAGEMSQLYQGAADEMLSVKVPTSLTQNHIDLINQYLENSTVMKFLSEASNNPLEAYAAFNILIKNSGKELELLGNIKSTLQAHGIIFNSI